MRPEVLAAQIDCGLEGRYGVEQLVAAKIDIAQFVHDPAVAQAFIDREFITARGFVLIGRRSKIADRGKQFRLGLAHVDEHGVEHAVMEKVRQRLPAIGIA